MAALLVVNAGSSSLKLSVLADDDAVVESRSIRFEELDSTLAQLPRVDAVGHRVVHGGDEFTAPVLVDEQVRARLEELTALAPLHQPKSLRALDAVTRALPGVPAIACFDTAFHATIPAAAATYALPAEWRERWRIRRYGFHGLSHAHVARVVGSGKRIVSCHLGAGASLCAIAGGRSVDTTMGFTPLEGLVMATRSGSVDPGLLLWLEEQGVPPAELAETLELRSGLLALAGSADLRVVLEAEAAGDERATLAVGVYLHRLRAAIAAMAAALGGVDALVFTGGVGENAASIRERACEGLAFLGVDPNQNVLVVPAREDLEIAAGVRALLSGDR